MFQDKSQLSNFLNKPYQLLGVGEPGYDCVTLTLAVLKEFTGFDLSEDISKKYIGVWEKKNLYLVFEEAEKFLDCIWKGSYTNFPFQQLKIMDVVMFRYFNMPSHFGVYVGDNQVITTRDNRQSELITLTDKVQLRCVCGIFRVK